MARIEPPDPEAIKTNELILHWKKIAGRAEITPQFIHDLEVNVFEDVMRYQGERIVLQMQSRILADKIDHEDVTVPFSKEVKVPAADVTVQARRFPAIPHAIGAVCFTVLAIVSAPIWAIVAVLLAALVVITWRLNSAVTFTIERGEIVVSGEVTIGADYWMTFPKNTRVYPKELGDAVRLIEYGEPDIRFEP